MKVVMTFDIDDDTRRAVSQHCRRNGMKRVPTLATREMIRDFVHQAVASHWLGVEDQARNEAEWAEQSRFVDRHAHLEERKYDIEVIRGYQGADE